MFSLKDSNINGHELSCCVKKLLVLTFKKDVYLFSICVD